MTDDTASTTSERDQVTTKPSERDLAVAAKRVFNIAIRKLRAAVEAGDVTPKEAKAMREEWYKSGAVIPQEYLEPSDGAA